MSGRISAATERALKRAASGQSIRSSARAEGINQSTLFRAIKAAGGIAGRSVIVGAGALGRELAQWIRRERPEQLVVFLDDRLRGTHIAGTVESYERQPGDAVLIAIADPAGRRAVGARIQAATWASESATVGQCQLGPGCLLLPGSLVSADAVLGECCVLNTHATVGHDVVLGDYVTLSSHVDLCGGVQVGAGVFFGSGARVLPGVSIGDGAYVGAGSVVMRDVPPGVRVAGNPARSVGAVE